MNKFIPIALLATVATLGFTPAQLFAAETNQQVQAVGGAVAAATPAAAHVGTMLYGPDGHRLEAVYRVAANGDAQIILNSKLVTVPAASLSTVNGKLATSLSKKEIARR